MHKPVYSGEDVSICGFLQKLWLVHFAYQEAFTILLQGGSLTDQVLAYKAASCSSVTLTPKHTLVGQAILQI